MRLSKQQIETFLTAKQDWIESHLQTVARQRQERGAFSLLGGASLTLLGQEYPVIRMAGRPRFQDNTFYLNGETEQQLREQAEGVYRSLAREILNSRVRRYSQILGVEPAAVRINGAKTRWGSCSGKNSLNFSWKLITAPPECVDYVVVHELSHIREHNHSPQFWEIVESVFPDYQRRRQGLRVVQEKLSLQNWDGE